MFIQFFQRINIVEPVVISLFKENQHSFVDMLGCCSRVTLCTRTAVQSVIYSTTKGVVLIHVITAIESSNIEMYILLIVFERNYCKKQ